MPLLAFFIFLWEVAMVLVYVDFNHATINCDTLYAKRIRMMKFAETTRKGSNRNLCAENKSVIENSTQ
jgi:hypothetical protein